jgi:hypothetical protein
MQNRNIIRIALGSAFILIMIMLMNQFNDEVDWKLDDFIAMGILLLSAGLAYELLAKKMTTAACRVAVAIAIGIVFLIIWAELAVGVFGTPFAGS